MATRFTERLESRDKGEARCSTAENKQAHSPCEQHSYTAALPYPTVFTFTWIVFTG